MLNQLTTSGAAAPRCESQMLTEFSSLSGKVAILGGSFDPIHSGHIELALAAKEQLGLDAVVFIPARKNPLKERSLGASRAERLHMVAAAIAGQEGLFVSPIDLRREGSSYTLHTVNEVWRTLPGGSELFFLAGSDQIRQLPSWRYIEELLTKVQFAPVTREGESTIDFEALTAAFGEDEAGLLREHLVQCRSPLSSTIIRNRVASRAAICGLVPPAVAAFIQSKSLYQKEEL